uniref:Uncharacterized protein n=1 Tax=Trypanosoma congolense (strain IL3000) TaxID=1068625 RepID=G0UYJ0_TRYCI|nr:conserved hypothetical protein [Trypanosoma congolense IL3000]
MGEVLRQQCMDFCCCTYCRRKRSCSRPSSNKIVLPECKTYSKDQLYVKALNDTLRAKSLMESMKNAHKFEPDEMLQSTRGNMARAALTVPVRRRDRLQELLILENKERLRTEQQLRRDQLRAGMTVSDGDTRMHDRAVATDDQEVTTEASTLPADVPRCSAEEDLQAALKTIKDITEEHNGMGQKQLLPVHIQRLRDLVRRQGKKTKNMMEGCPEQPHLCGHCFAVNAEGKHKCQVPPAHVLRDSLLPSIGGKAQCSNFSSYPCVTDGSKKDLSIPISQGHTGGFSAEGDANYNAGPQLNAEGISVRDAEGGANVKEEVKPPQCIGKDDLATINRGDVQNGRGTTDSDEAVGKKKCPTQSSASLWITTNQETERQMKRFMDFKGLHTQAARLYAEGETKRPSNNAVMAANQ